MVRITKGSATAVLMAVVLVPATAGAAGKTRLPRVDVVTALSGALPATLTKGDRYTAAVRLPSSVPATSLVLQRRVNARWITVARATVRRGYAARVAYRPASNTTDLRVRLAAYRRGRILYASPAKRISLVKALALGPPAPNAVTGGSPTPSAKTVPGPDGSPPSPAHSPREAGLDPVPNPQAASDAPGTDPQESAGSAEEPEVPKEPSTSLRAGESLKADESLVSPSRQYQLVMQGDGNLVLYTQGRALWDTKTAGNPGARTVMQDDGNLVVYTADGRALWNAGSQGSGALHLQDDGNLVIYTSDDRALWNSGTWSSAMTRNEQLRPGHYLLSPNRQYTLVMQTDGNLVEYTQGRPIWASGTAGHGGAWAVMQGDGNLVVYTADGAPLWNSGTAGHAGSSMQLQDDSNVVVYDPGSRPLWASGLHNDRMVANETLLGSQMIVSADGAYRFVMQGDGNLVLYRGSAPLWASNTAGQPGSRAVMQGDGNLVVYNPAGRPIWASHTDRNAGAFVVAQSDGNVVIYTSRALWATNTVQGAPAGAPGTPTDDYPANLRNAPQDSLNDPWQFLNRECTSFVAWRMNRDGGAGSFSNGMRGGWFGDAYTWASNAARIGMAVNGTPRVGAIAHWGRGEMGDYGHVAYVVATHPDGSVDIEDYNYLRGRYRYARGVRAPRYIHVR